jgi:hypothetical protein
VRELPYQRNSDKDDLSLVLSEGCGTCGTKHALLAQLAIENNVAEVSLYTGVFQMNAVNTPAVAETLRSSGLDYIPESHNYLRAKGEIVDCTTAGFGPDKYLPVLMLETQIGPGDIGQKKVDIHKAFLAKWLADHPELVVSQDELWLIREKCISDLQASGFGTKR